MKGEALVSTIPWSHESRWSHQKLIAVILAVTFAALALGWLSVFSPIIVIILAGATICSAVFLLRPVIVTSVLLFLYPSVYTWLDDLRLFPDTPLEISPLGLLNAILPLLLIALFLLRRREIKRKPFFTYMLMLFVIALMPSVLLSPFPLLSLRFFFRLVMPISFYLVYVAFLATEAGVHKVSRTLMYSAFVPIAFSFLQRVPGSNIYHGKMWWYVSGEPRVYGTFSHPNGFAVFLVLILLYLLFTLLMAEHIPIARAGFVYSFFAAGVMALFFTYTRIAWAAFISCGTIVWFLSKKRRKYAFALITIIALGWIVFEFSKLILVRLKPDSSVYQHFDLMTYYWGLFKRSPLFGVGLGSGIVLSLEAFGALSVLYGNAAGVSAHNDYLSFLAESGLIGFMGYVVLLSSMLIKGVQMYADKTTASHWGGLLLCIVIAVVVIGLTDAGFAYGSIYFWTLVAVAELGYRIRAERRQDTR